MIPSLNGTAVTGISSGVTSQNVSFTVAGGVVSGKLMVVVNNRQFVSAPAVSSITWKGSPLTQILNNASTSRIAVFYLDNPSSGAGTVTVTWGGANNSAAVSVFMLQNAGGTDVADWSDFSGTATSTMTENTADDDELILYISFSLNETPASLGAGQTAISLVNTGAYYQSVSMKDAATAGSQTASVTYAHSTDGTKAFVSITGSDAFVPQVLII